MFHLIHRALARVFVRAPTQKFCAVPKSAAGKMVIGNFNDDSWIDGFPFAGAVCAPTARSSGALPETREVENPSIRQGDKEWSSNVANVSDSTSEIALGDESSSRKEKPWARFY